MLAERYHAQSCDWRKKRRLMRGKIRKGFTVLVFLSICIAPDATGFQDEKETYKSPDHIALIDLK